MTFHSVGLELEAVAVPSVCVIVLTYNEELHIGRSLKSAFSISDAVYVVDSYSTDRTVAIAREMGAEVIQRAFVSQADQFAWALDKIGRRYDWVVRIDADEYLGSDLMRSLRSMIDHCSPDVSGMTLNRKQIFMGQWIRHGGRYPLRMLRVVRSVHAIQDRRNMDEHLHISQGQILDINGDFYDDNLAGIDHFIRKHLDYAKREASARNDTPYVDVSGGRSARQTMRSRWLKAYVYERIPPLWRPALYFMYRYILRLGFLDGRAGFAYHFLQGWWYRTLVELEASQIEPHK